MWQCPFHIGETFTNIYAMISHINSDIEKNGLDLKPADYPPIDQGKLTTKPKNINAPKKKPKDAPRYAPSLVEVNMAIIGPSAYGGIHGNDDSGSIRGYQDFRNKPQKTIDKLKLIRPRRTRTPKKRRVWSRHYEGAPAYPYPERFVQPEIPAVKALKTLENYVIDYYDNKINAFDKQLVLSADDVVLKDKMVHWLYDMVVKQLAVYDVDLMIDVADTAGYLQLFDNAIDRIQRAKFSVVLR